MPGWLKKIWTTLGAVEAKLSEPWLFDLLIATTNTLRRLHSHLNSGLHNLWYGAHSTWWGSKWLGYETSLSFYDIYRYKLPRLRRLIAWLYAWDKREHKQLYKHTEDRYHDSRAYTHSRILAVIAWVISKVFLVLLAFIRTLFSWVMHEGATMWHYFTHLDQFAQLLGKFLVAWIEKESMWVARNTTRFFVAFMFHNLRTLLLILEDAIVSVL